MAAARPPGWARVEPFCLAGRRVLGVPVATTTGLRFVTVHGPWGRPDMAIYMFTKAMLAGETDRRIQSGRDAA
jgi:nucleoside-diphosphate-sugar epimerase